MAVEGCQRLARRAARRAAASSSRSGSEAAAVSRAERRHLAGGPREHRRPEADRPERRGHPGQDRADPEGGALPAAPVALRQPARLDTFPAILTNSFIQQQKTELAQLQSSTRRWASSSATGIPTWSSCGRRSRSPRPSWTREIGKVVQSVRRTSTWRRWPRRTAWPVALNQQKGDALAMNRKAIDYSVLERDVQSEPAALRQPAAAGQGNRRHHRAEDQQHPRGRSGRDSRAARSVPQRRSEPAARPLRRRAGWRAGWRSSSSISTAASRRRTRSGSTSACPTWDCCRRSTTRPWRPDIRWSATVCRPTSPRRSAPCGPTCCSRRRRRARDRSSSPAPGPAKARAWWRAIWRSRWRRPDSASC